MSDATDECTIYLENTEWQKILKRSIRTSPLLWAFALCLHVIWKLDFKVTFLFFFCFSMSSCTHCHSGETECFWTVTTIVNFVFWFFLIDLVFFLQENLDMLLQFIKWGRKKVPSVANDSSNKFFFSLLGVFWLEIKFCDKRKIKL